MSDPSAPNAQVMSIIVVHPKYLKVRMSGVSPESRYVWDAQQPLLLGPDVLQDLSALYQP
jgi:hypothetical protein